MSSFRILFDPIWSWPIVALVTLVAGITVWLGYQKTRQLSGGRRSILLGIRLTTLLVLLVAMLRPQLQWISEDGEPAQIWILADASRSMTVQDGPGGISRRESLLQTLTGVKSSLNLLGKEVELEQFDFSDTLKATSEFELESPGQQTALGTTLKEALRAHAQRPISSIFLLTDGAQRAVPPFNDDPRELARELGELGVSLYPIPIGQASSTLSAADVAIDEIQVDPVVFVKKRIPIRVNVRWNGAAAQTLRIRLLLEDRSGLRAEESGPLKPIPVNEYSQTTAEIQTRYAAGSEVVELSFTPELAGEYKIAAEVEPLSGEVQTQNNLRETLMTVRQGGLRIAYFDIFRTEIKSIRQLNASEKMQIDFQMIRPSRFSGGGNAVDLSWFEQGRYDVYILGDVSAAQLGPAAVEQLAERIREGAGLMLLGGYHSYSAGGYAETPLRDLLPVQLNPAEKLAETEFDQSQQIQEELTFQPTPLGNQHYVTRIETPARNQAAWEELPPFTGATRLQPKTDFVSVLATSKQGNPLIIAAETGRSRVMCLAFDQTYLWAQAGFEQTHRRFWRQAVLWLARKELDTDQPIWLTLMPKAIDPGGRVHLEYGARDEAGQPLTEATFRVSVKTPSGKSESVSGSSTEVGESAIFSMTSEPGDYFVQVEATQNRNSVGFPAMSRFLVHDRDLELDNPVVDHGLLEEMAQQAGFSSDSHLIASEQLKDFLEEYLKRKPWQSGLEAHETMNLWDGWPILLIFASLMTLEWIIRKSAGLV